MSTTPLLLRTDVADELLDMLDDLREGKAVHNLEARLRIVKWLLELARDMEPRQLGGWISTSVPSTTVDYGNTWPGEIVSGGVP